MDKTQDLALSTTRENTIYRNLLLLYPKAYRNRFGQEMLYVFQDLYQEAVTKRGSAGATFWLSVILDAIQSATVEHLAIIKKQGMKKYFKDTLNLNKFNVIGGILLLPAFIMTLIEVTSRIVQGDLFHYNRTVYNFISHSPLYWFPILITWVLLFPALAVILNIIPLMKKLSQNHDTIFSFSFIKQNSISLVFLLVGLGFLAMIVLHDFAACMVNGIFSRGFNQFFPLLQYCRGA